MKFQIRLRNQIAALPLLLVILAGLFAVAWYVNFDRAAIVIFSLSIVFISAPAVYLHVEYFLKNSGQIIEITSHEIILQRRSGEVEMVKEIEEAIRLLKNVPFERRKTPFAGLHFAPEPLKMFRRMADDSKNG